MSEENTEGQEEAPAPPPPGIRIVVREHDFDIVTDFDEPNTLMWLEVAKLRIYNSILGN